MVASQSTNTNLIVSIWMVLLPNPTPKTLDIVIVNLRKGTFQNKGLIL